MHNLMQYVDSSDSESDFEAGSEQTTSPSKDTAKKINLLETENNGKIPDTR